MSVGHCLISYSTADGLEFTRRLADELESSDPQIPTWYDKRDITAGYDWDDQIVEAIKTCKCLLFVMTLDSTKASSDCKNEILFALRYKKPILPILLHKNAEPIFVLVAREYIDFTGGFKTGMPRLRKYVRELDLPEGILRTLKERLADAEHDLRRATGEEADRIKVETADLNKQIDIQQRIVDDPEGAKKQTERNIQTGLERERKPQLPLVGIQSTKFINPPPGIAPNYFQDRAVETKQIVDFLNDDSQRLMTIVGRGGVGKTAMICRLLKHLENSALPDDLVKSFGELKPPQMDGIIYLSESGSHRATFANIFYDLCQLLPSDAAQELGAVYKNPQGSTESKMRALLEKFPSGRVVVLLDNFEPLVDTGSFVIRDAELDEALRAFLNGTHTAVNIVITTRVAPKPLNLIQPGRVRVLTLDEGLESPYAENILREMDSDGRLGLKSATDNLLKRAKDKTRGFPRALEALFAILASDRYTTLEELLALPLPENVVDALVGEAFNRLDANAQKVMQALAVYNRPVTPAAVDYLLAPQIPAMDSAPILQRLASMHFARKESGRFYLHPVDREFAFGLIPEKDLTTKDTKVTKDFVEEADSVIKVEPDDIIPASDEAEDDSDKDFNFDFESLFNSWRASQHDAFTQHDLTLRAADYFAQARKPRAEWKKLDDLSAQLAEFDLRCAAGDYDTAADVLTDIDFDYLLLWGHFRFTIELHEKLQGKIIDLTLKMISLGKLGSANAFIGKVQNAIVYQEQGLSIARERKDRRNEGAFLSNLGNRYAELGEIHKAIEYHEQALVIDQEIGNQLGESVSLHWLGACNASIGKYETAIDYYNSALTIAKNSNAWSNEAWALGNLGDCFIWLGQSTQAIAHQEKAIAIRREIGDRRGEAIGCGEVGYAYLSLGDFDRAENNFKLSIQISNEISSPEALLIASSGLTQAYLFQNDLANARASIETALQYDVPSNNHDASALHGIIALRQEDEVTAREAFTRAIAQADDILAKTPEYYSALDAKGLALCGLAILGDPSGFENPKGLAAETFRMARKIAPHAGVVTSNLRLFDELVKCDEAGVLKNVRAAVEGKG